MSKKTDLNKIFAWVMALAGAIILAAVLILSFRAVKTLGTYYRMFTEADLSQPFKNALFYEDNLYASVGYGIEILPGDSGKEATLSSFIGSSMYGIGLRVFSVGIFYTMMICTVLAFPLYQASKGKKGRHVFFAVLSVFGVYALYLGAVALVHKMYDIPFFFPEGRDLFVILTGIFSVAGGMCALAYVIRSIAVKKLISLFAIPVVFALFIFGVPFQAGLYTSPTVDSFAYIGDIDPRYSDESYDGVVYDEEKNVMVVDGKEYAPEQVPNPDYLSGTSRIGAAIFEVADPLSGNSLPLVNEIIEKPVPAYALFGHIVKGILWIVLPLVIKKKS